MKKYELEAILKSFLLFFALQSIVLWLLYTQNLSSKKEKYDEQLLSQMNLCSYTLKCKEFDFDFVDKKNQHISKLMKNSDEVYTLFDIPNSKEYLLKLFFSKKIYHKKLKEIKNRLQKEYLPYLFLIMILSVIFAYYSLYPLKKALKINEEFIKDILHDFNTPISSLMINFKLFEKKIGSDRKIDRMKTSLKTMLSLQNNLKYFLENSNLQKDTFSLKKIIENRLSYFYSLYPNIDFSVELQELQLYTNKDAFLRIIDNLLSNATKHNIQNGYVKIYTNEHTIMIENSSKEIKNPQKLFDRYYKESQRGLGLGLNIVKKLSQELDIDVEFNSYKDKTIFVLKLDKVIFD